MPAFLPSDDGLSDGSIETLRRRSRVLMLLDAAERAGLAPLSTSGIHSLAYLADVLSPVWHLPAFTASVLKIAGGPFYRDLQTELDRLVVLGLVEVSDLSYIDRPRGGARLDANYGLNFEAPKLEAILAGLGARELNLAFDPRDHTIHTFLVELAGAFASLSETEMKRAATLDVTWSEAAAANNLLEMDSSKTESAANLSVATADRFSNFVPADTRLLPGEKIYLYASYLGRKANAS